MQRMVFTQQEIQAVKESLIFYFLHQKINTQSQISLFIRITLMDLITGPLPGRLIMNSNQIIQVGTSSFFVLAWKKDWNTIQSLKRFIYELWNTLGLLS